jgi:hypothetical protein
LCEVVHAGATSVLSYATATPDRFAVVSQSLERDAVESFRSSFEEVAFTTLANGVMCPIVVLATLNLFELPEIRTPLDGKIDLDGLPIWGEIHQTLASQRDSS